MNRVVAVTLMLAAAILVTPVALANSVPISTFNLTNVGSGENSTEFWSSDPSSTINYRLLLNNTPTGFAGGFYAATGNTYLYGTLPSVTLANGTLTASFTGTEFVRLGVSDWVYYTVSGTLTESVTFGSATGTGTINITSSVFEGPATVAPEPGTAALLLMGAPLVYQRLKRKS